MTAPENSPDRLLLSELTRLDLDTEALVQGVADVLDVLRRPLDDGTGVTSRAVLRATVDRLTAVLSAHGGVRLVGEPGELAAPHTHRVVDVTDATGLPADTVVKVIEHGVRYRGGLLRPAAVVVASGKGIQ
ncbi:nucleotide exchange factor GrpE [Amycolatopsis sp. NPDC004079]|uniref:nucleotide exchange factor GrpE n=1 Tax=Amycolatopsis sp. NPDC004079 TaxID=3154549 RepID=UPI0033BAAC2E